MPLYYIGVVFLTKGKGLAGCNQYLSQPLGFHLDPFGNVVPPIIICLLISRLFTLGFPDEIKYSRML